MKYLFFDIECANRDNTGRNQIYSFGYLLADENMHILERENDILINPNVKQWDKHVLREMLAYPKTDVESQPKFNKVYTKIKNLLENPETVVCGFSVKDDVGYLLDECERYECEPFQFKFYDVQRLAAKVTGTKVSGLGTAYVEWCGRLADDAHRSDVDARYTYEVAKAICHKTNKELIDLFQENEVCQGKIDGFRFGYSDEELLTRDERRAKREEKRMQYFSGPKEKNGERILKEEYQDFILKGSRNNLLFLRLLDHVQPKNAREQIFVGKKISISLNYELYHFRNMLKIVQMICDCGGEYVKKASIADIFVSYEDVENGRTCTKQKFVEEAIANGAQIQMMSFEEFLKQLNLTEEELNALPDEDVDYLLDEKYKKK